MFWEYSQESIWDYSKELKDIWDCSKESDNVWDWQ